jgi:thioredoxin-like negative regulator of GroEL
MTIRIVRTNDTATALVVELRNSLNFSPANKNTTRDFSPAAAAKYNVSAMPTFLFLKQGEVVDRLMGASPSRLQELIEEHK